MESWDTHVLEQRDSSVMANECYISPSTHVCLCENYSACINFIVA